MKTRPCLNCHTSAVLWLEDASKGAFVNYFRCEQCGDVWTMGKDEPQIVSYVSRPAGGDMEFSRQVQLRLITREISRANTFLRSAETIRDATAKKQFLAYAREAYSTASVVLRKTTQIEPAFRQTLQRQLDDFDEAISKVTG